MRFWFQLGLLLICVSATPGQTVEINGGGSNFLGSGGGITLFGPNSETHLMAGILNDSVVYAADTEFELHKWDITVGDQQFFLTTGQLALTTPVRGMSFRRERGFSCKPKTQKNVAGYQGQNCFGDQIRLFVGAAGDTFSSPYFYSIRHAHAAAGLSYKRELTRRFTVGTIQAVTGQRKTSLEDLDYKLGRFEIRGQGGWLLSNPQFGGDLNFTTRHLGLDANRSTYIFNVSCSGCPPLIAPRVTTNSFSGYGGYGWFNASASLFDSSINRGEAFNTGAHFGWLQVQASDYKSGKLSSQLLTLTERAGLHLSLSEYITRSRDTWNYNFGLSYTSNRFNFQVGYSVLYFPLLRDPFQRVLNLQIGFRIKSASINAATAAQPNGRNQWAVGADDYQQTRLHLPAIGTGEESFRSLPQYGRGGKYCMAGVVLDTDAKPVEGAAIVIGRDTVYTNSQGMFSSRQKHKTNPIRVDLDNFMLPGTWEVVSAPSTGTAGEHVTITLKKKL